MSIEMLNAGWNTEGLTPTKKLILLLLCNYADENKQCYPSHRHIADKVGLKDTKGVQRTIKEFHEKGFLSIEHRKDSRGSYTSNKYTLLLPTSSDTTRVAKDLSERVKEPVNTKEDTKTLYSDDFNKFWESYPRKIGKYKAALSFKKSLKVEEFIKLWSACRNFALICEKENTEEYFIPHASTWLNQRRYLDYLEIKVSKNKNNLNTLAG